MFVIQLLVTNGMNTGVDCSVGVTDCRAPKENGEKAVNLAPETCLPATI